MKSFNKNEACLPIIAYGMFAGENYAMFFQFFTI